MAQLGIQPKRSLGQNFLISQSVIEQILEEVEALRGHFDTKRLIEIGPGLGSLTEGLLQLPFDQTLLLELDSELAEAWRQAAATRPDSAGSVEVHEGDALHFPWERESSPFLLVSNLPYQISSSIVIEMSVADHPPAGMVLMFQREVAERIQARCSTAEYGLLSVIAQNAWLVSRVCDAGPRDFEPAPRVASRVLAFRPVPSPTEFDRTGFLRFVKAGWRQRRKLLAANLVGAEPHLQNRVQVDAWLERLGVPLKTRAEELSPVQWRQLFLGGPFESPDLSKRTR
jgi:16S rRNA (adenine1518-N6/adenine1519-N6)-dimethyltransferase